MAFQTFMTDFLLRNTKDNILKNVGIHNILQWKKLMFLKLFKLLKLLSTILLLTIKTTYFMYNGRTSYRFGTTWRWINDNRICFIILGWNIPLNRICVTLKMRWIEFKMISYNHYHFLSHKVVVWVRILEMKCMCHMYYFYGALFSSIQWNWSSRMAKRRQNMVLNIFGLCSMEERKSLRFIKAQTLFFSKLFL